MREGALNGSFSFPVSWYFFADINSRSSAEFFEMATRFSV